MKKSHLVFFILMILATNLKVKADALPEIPFSIYKHELDDYYKYLNGRAAHQIKYYGGKYARRDIVERVLVQQAIWFGGYPHQVKWLPVQNYSHALQKLALGRVAVMGTPAWLSDLRRGGDSYLIAAPILRNNEFLVGIYTNPLNRKALQAKTIDDFLNLSITSTRYWFVDWRTIKVLGFKNIVESKSWVEIVKKIASRKVDITLAPFEASPSMKLDFQGATMLPIRNIRVALHDSRHYAVSSVYDKKQEIYQAMQKGFKLLREKGQIKRAYIECGFFHPDTQTWPIFNEMVEKNINTHE